MDEDDFDCLTALGSHEVFLTIGEDIDSKDRGIDATDGDELIYPEDFDEDFSSCLQRAEDDFG